MEYDLDLGLISIEDRPKIIMNAREAAEFMKVSRNTFRRRFIDTNLIPMIVYDESQDTPLFYLEDIVDFIKKSRRYFSNEGVKKPEARASNIERYQKSKKEDATK